MSNLKKEKKPVFDIGDTVLDIRFDHRCFVIGKHVPDMSGWSEEEKEGASEDYHEVILRGKKFDEDIYVHHRFMEVLVPVRMLLTEKVNTLWSSV